MRRILMILIALMVVVLSAHAQTGLNIASIFDGSYSTRQDATSVQFSGSRLKAFNLSLSRSLSLTPSATDTRQIEAAVLRDAAHAVSKEEVRKSGHVYYGFYKLSSVGAENRYIFYRNNSYQTGSDGRLTLIYLQGRATAAELKRMFSK